jgi:hypothetical protein
MLSSMSDLRYIRRCPPDLETIQEGALTMPNIFVFNVQTETVGNGWKSRVRQLGVMGR